MDVFAANNLSAFSVTSGTPTESTTSGTVNTTYSPRSIRIQNAAVRSARFINPTTGADTSLTSFWVHFELYVQATGSFAGLIDDGCLYVVNSAGTRVIRLNLLHTSNGNPVYRLDYWNGSSFVNGSSTLTLSTETSYAFDLEIVCGVSGSLKLYTNSSSQSPLSPSLTVTGLHAAVTNGAYLDLNCPLGFLIDANNYYSQILVSEEATIGCRVGSIVPTAAGTNTTWTGTYTDITDSGLGEGTVISASSTGDKESYPATDRALPVHTYEVGGVWFNIRAKQGGSAPTNKKALMRVGGTDYAAAYDYAHLNTSTFAPSLACFPLNPATAAAWDISDVNAAEVGFEATT